MDPVQLKVLNLLQNLPCPFEGVHSIASEEKKSMQTCHNSKISHFLCVLLKIGFALAQLIVHRPNVGL